MSGDLGALEERLGWVFRDRKKLEEALTHSTFANENPGSGPDNERLEFLGDAVLDLLVAAILYSAPARFGEGEMSRRRARVVRRGALAKLAESIDLGQHLRLGIGQARTGRTESILANAFEALVGAVFIDGGYEAVERSFASRLECEIEAAIERIDFKTQLQELCHTLGFEPPEYTLVEIEGPDHAQHFRTEVLVQGKPLGTGQGNNKKAAEQQAARQAVETLEVGRFDIKPTPAGAEASA
jgi:ribonuclease-3